MIINYNIHNTIEIAVIFETESNNVQRIIDTQLREYEVIKLTDVLPKLEIYVVEDINQYYENIACEKIGKSRSNKIISNGQFYFDCHRKIKVEKNDNGFICKIYVEDESIFTLNPFIHYDLSLLGFTFLHSAALSFKGNAIVFPAFGGIGKTALLSSFDDKDDYKIMGDDLNILSSDNTIISFSRAFILYDYHKKMFPKVFKNKKNKLKSNDLKRFIFKLFYTSKGKEVARFILGLLPNKIANKLLYKYYTPEYDLIVFPSEIFNNGKVEKSEVKLQSYIFLSRSDNITELDINAISKEELLNRMFSIIMNEWRNDLDMLFDMGGFNFIDMSEFTSRIKMLISNSIDSVDGELYKVDIPSEIDDKKYIEFMHTEILNVFENNS